jgi:hypothetical protein
MRTITVAGIDPSLTHTGIAKATLDIDTGLVTVTKVLCVATEGDTGKTVRRNSDDLRRSGLIAKAIYEEVADCDVIFSEVPTGAQSSRAAFSFGMVIGILAAVIHSPGFKPAFIQVLPHQVKSAIPGGSKNTSKEEIIDWAVTSWPQAGWLDMKGRKYEFAGMKLNANVEHPADACAAINAGLLTDDFKNLLALIKKLTPVSA